MYGRPEVDPYMAKNPVSLSRVGVLFFQLGSALSSLLNLSRSELNRCKLRQFKNLFKLSGGTRGRDMHKELERIDHRSSWCHFFVMSGRRNVTADVDRHLIIIHVCIRQVSGWRVKIEDVRKSRPYRTWYEVLRFEHLFCSPSLPAYTLRSPVCQSAQWLVSVPLCQPEPEPSMLPTCCLLPRARPMFFPYNQRSDVALLALYYLQSHKPHKTHAYHHHCFFFLV